MLSERAIIEIVGEIRACEIHSLRTISYFARIRADEEFDLMSKCSPLVASPINETIHAKCLEDTGNRENTTNGFSLLDITPHQALRMQRRTRYWHMHLGIYRPRSLEEDWSRVFIDDPMQQREGNYFERSLLRARLCLEYFLRRSYPVWQSSDRCSICRDEVLLLGNT